MVCKKCGETVMADAKFCGKCGTAMNVEMVSEQSNDTQVCVAETTTEFKSTPASIALNGLGVLFYIVAAIDFAGMLFDYDFTGVSWSPIAFGVVGGACQTLSEILKK